MVDPLYASYKQEFPIAIPTYDDVDSLQRVYNNLFERYMNTHLGFGKKTAEYLDFINSCTNTSDKYCNQALSFNGMAGKRRVTIPVRNNRLKLGTGDFTFEVRMKPKTHSPFNEIMSNRTYTNGSLSNGFSFLMQNDGKLLINLEGCYNYQTTSTGGINVFDGKPHHVAVSRQGDSLGMYIDGIKLSYSIVCTGPVTTPPSQRNISTNGPWYIGYDSATEVASYTPAAFNGWIDEVSVEYCPHTGPDRCQSQYPLNTSGQPDGVLPPAQQGYLYTKHPGLIHCR
ncbi:LamG domain-containing protein [Paraflavitalea speifideaquila]|uniref:LamG domain-containing protein n=1 Tax=Paraflavitalea speifideaquila TaxID=3076558 RepID=UPI0028EA4FA6|nr:LamG domain-containing protein [Paraflavitalea speifideiaquila]